MFLYTHSQRNLEYEFTNIIMRHMKYQFKNIIFTYYYVNLLFTSQANQVQKNKSYLLIKHIIFIYCYCNKL